MAKFFDQAKRLVKNLCKVWGKLIIFGSNFWGKMYITTGIDVLFDQKVTQGLGFWKLKIFNLDGPCPEARGLASMASSFPGHGTRQT